MLINNILILGNSRDLIFNPLHAMELWMDSKLKAQFSIFRFSNISKFFTLLIVVVYLKYKLLKNISFKEMVNISL